LDKCNKGVSILRGFPSTPALVARRASCAIRIYWENLSLLHAELDAKNFKFAKPQIEKTDWETLELTITDPFSNRIIFWEDA
jgi:hypothetical protein